MHRRTHLKVLHDAVDGAVLIVGVEGHKADVREAHGAIVTEVCHQLSDVTLQVQELQRTTQDSIQTQEMQLRHTRFLA